MKTEQTTTQSRQEAFDKLKRQAEKGLAIPAKTDYSLVYPLACAVARGVLRKVIDKTGNTTLYQLKAQLEKDIHLIEDTKALNEQATAYRYNKEGMKEYYIADSNINNALKSLERENLSDAYDLVIVAYTALIEQAQKHDITELAWLDKPFIKKVLDKRVIIRRDDSAAYKEVKTTPIQEVYKAVRQAIDNSASVQAASLKYTYIEEMTEQEGEKAYRRLPKYMDIGAEDKEGIYTADAQTADDMFTIIEKLNLSDRQTQILKLRLKGYGQRAIGTYLGITDRAVRFHLQAIQAKAEKIQLVSVCKA